MQPLGNVGFEVAEPSKKGDSQQAISKPGGKRIDDENYRHFKLF
jgi:hypothetical protein